MVCAIFVKQAWDSYFLILPWKIQQCCHLESFTNYRSFLASKNDARYIHRHVVEDGVDREKKEDYLRNIKRTVCHRKSNQ